jgi:hypothetical protein
MKAFSVWRSVMLGLLLVGSAAAQAAVSCNIRAQNLGELYDSAASMTSLRGDLTINCTRSLLSDPSTVYYSIKADFGGNSTGGVTRNVKNSAVATNNTLLWVLRTGAIGNTTDWGTTAAVGLLTGNLSFAGTALATSATINNAYAMGVRGTAGGNPGFPAAGTYVDTVTLAPDMSTTSVNGPYNVTAPIAHVSFTVGVNPVCVMRAQGPDLTFNYTSFSQTPQTQNSIFQAICSDTLPYSVTVSPPNGTIAGINYTVTRLGNLNRTGNGNSQNANMRVDIAANQSGTCATAVCRGSVTHTVTITY